MRRSTPPNMLNTDQRPRRPAWRQFLFILMGDRVGFPIDIVFRLSPTEPASMQFLGRFAAEAPFKMSAKHFRVGVISKSGRIAWSKPEARMAAKLEEFVG